MNAITITTIATVEINLKKYQACISSLHYSTSASQLPRRLVTFSKAVVATYPLRLCVILTKAIVGLQRKRLHLTTNTPALEEAKKKTYPIKQMIFSLGSDWAVVIVVVVVTEAWKREATDCEWLKIVSRMKVCGIWAGMILLCQQ